LSEETNIPEEEIRDIVNFYWEMVRKTMEDLEEPRICIDGLGTFYVKPKSLAKEIYKNETYIKGVDPQDFNKYPLYANAQKRLEKFKALKDKVYEENDRKVKLRKQRFNEVTGHLEKQGEDPRGTN